MTRYELWMHRQTNTVYAVRMIGERLSGACGPLSQAAISRRKGIAAADYADVVVTGRLEAQRALFSVIDTWSDNPEEIEDLGAVTGIQWFPQE